MNWKLSEFQTIKQNYNPKSWAEQEIFQIFQHKVELTPHFTHFSGIIHIFKTEQNIVFLSLVEYIHITQPFCCTNYTYLDFLRWTNKLFTWKLIFQSFLLKCKMNLKVNKLFVHKQKVYYICNCKSSKPILQHFEFNIMWPRS